MALAAATHWEIRASTGSDLNGGGFAGKGHFPTLGAPTVTGSGTGGTVAANTYYTVVTYSYYNGATNFDGPKSAATTTTTTGTTSTLTVTSPAATTGATHYRVWMGTSSAGPWFIQNGTGTAIGTNYARTTTPATSGANPPGVDYSQQDAAQVVIDAATITTTVTTGSATITFTGGTYAPSQNDVGNYVRLNGGTGVTLGYRQIVSVNGNNWVCDAAIQTSGSTQTNLTARMGGALASFSLQTTTTMQASVVANNRIYIKAGTYSETLTTTVSGGSGRGGIYWIGYNTTRDDNPKGANRPLIDGGSARTNCISAGASTNVYAHLRCASATGSCVQSAANVLSLFYNVKASAAGASGFNNSNTNSWRFVHCEAASNTAHGFSSASALNPHINCYSHDNGGAGYDISSSGNQIYVGCVADTNAGNNFEIGSGLAVNCTSYNATASGHGYVMAGGGLFTIAVNCISSADAGTSYLDSGGGGFTLINCHSYGAGTTISGLAETFVPFGALNTSDPQFTDAGNGDFRVGANMKAAGLSVGVNEGLVADGYVDLGAVQRVEPAGGALSRIFTGF